MHASRPLPTDNEHFSESSSNSSERDKGFRGLHGQQVTCVDTALCIGPAPALHASGELLDATGLQWKQPAAGVLIKIESRFIGALVITPRPRPSGKSVISDSEFSTAPPFSFSQFASLAPLGLIETVDSQTNWSLDGKHMYLLQVAVN